LLFDDALETGRVVARLPGPAGQGKTELPDTFNLAGQGWWERLLPRLRESSAPLPINDLAAQPRPRRSSDAPPPPAGLGAQVSSALLLPLHAASGLIGLIALGRSQARPFGGENVEFSGLLVGHIVAALDNTLQFGRSQERLSEQALVSQISRSLSR